MAITFGVVVHNAKLDGANDVPADPNLWADWNGPTTKHMPAHESSFDFVSENLMQWSEIAAFIY